MIEIEAVSRGLVVADSPKVPEKPQARQNCNEGWAVVVVASANKRVRKLERETGLAVAERPESARGAVNEEAEGRPTTPSPVSFRFSMESEESCAVTDQQRG
jgi:hypothetical protein